MASQNPAKAGLRAWAIFPGSCPRTETAPPSRPLRFLSLRPRFPRLRSGQAGHAEQAGRRVPGCLVRLAHGFSLENRIMLDLGLTNWRLSRIKESLGSSLSLGVCCRASGVGRCGLFGSRTESSYLSEPSLLSPKIRGQLFFGMEGRRLFVSPEVVSRCRRLTN